jgi:hypothetical protein
VPLWIRVRLTLKHSFTAQEFLKRAFGNRVTSRARTNLNKGERKKAKARPAGLEPATHGLEIRWTGVLT